MGKAELGASGPPSLSAAMLVWARIACLSFGGPAGQIALMHRVIVEEKKWVSEARFLHALNFCMLLPGPEAQQLATYLGWTMHRVRGGLMAGILFVLPGFAAVLALSWAYLLYGNNGLLAAVLIGLKAAVMAIVVDAVRRIGGRTLHSWPLGAIAVAAFVGIVVLAVPFPAIVAGAAMVGFVGVRRGWVGFDGAVTNGVDEQSRPSRRRALATAAVLLVLWLGPVALLLALLGPDDVFSQIAALFARLAALSFGGAYAALVYVGQQAVDQQGWLRPDEMMDGLAMTEATPGPLIMVVQFVAFLAAARLADGMDPLLAGTLGAMLAAWVTFAPSFLWVFVGAPSAERLRGNRALSGALTAITAAVVGVIASLALWFAVYALFAERQMIGGVELPVLASLQPVAALLTVAALVALLWLRIGAGWVLAGSAAVAALVYAFS